MKKFYKVFGLVLIFFILTTYNPIKNITYKNEANYFLKVKKIEITNNQIIKKEIIFKKLEHILNKNILFIKKNDISNYLKSIDYLDYISVKKKYPDTLRIKIYETKPIAVLYKKNKKYIIDSSSKLILHNQNLTSKNLPEIYGEGAENFFVNFFKKLKTKKFPIKNIKKFYFFKIERWDIELKNNKIIKFPSQKIDVAIKESIKLLNRDDFKKYNTIDLRIDGNIVVE